MKYLLLLLCSIGFAQPYLSVGIDGRNAIIGSDPTNNNPEIDALFRFGAISYAGAIKNVKIGGVIEKFNAIDFNKYAFEIGYVFRGDILELQTTIEAGWIERYKMNYWTVGMNNDVIYWVNDNLGIVLTNNLSHRTDLDALYGGKNYKFSNYLGIHYKF